ncbi:MAG: type II toxin-antitoxin system VapC family toxin [Candidatus Methanoperedens sp.]|nr:type II toxin-antitoxin system VapC family toxin [Candidatus Methanoperedens sp.]MCZ7358946.1 type II toxin-antitoxin system VapC family toxin [Candidatus Methanoperedens sp.]HLB70803.1 type II toxin-antitoxin system VapC family toxin [Candidatus Methanoperedens sp.]
MRYVDSNIFISNLIGDKRLGQAAEKYLEAAASGKEAAATSVHTMIEIYAFLKGKRLTEHRISEILTAINQHGVAMLSFGPEIMKEALSMVKKNWKLGDAIHYVTMKNNNIEEIVTDDSHFDNVEGIKRIDVLKLRFE